MCRTPISTSILRAHEPHRLFLRRLFSNSMASNGIRKVSSIQPQLSASLVVVNQRNEILLVQRNPNASTFGGMHVFPGGNSDDSQDESLAMTAIRETFEESGLLLARSTGDPSAPFPSDSIVEEARHAIHEQRMNFKKFLQTYRLVPDLDSLLPFTQWVTPIGLPRRFKTQFYVTFLPSASPSNLSSSSGPMQEKLPTHNGGREVTETRFLHPKTILEECRNRKIRCMPPQFYILSTLAEILSGPICTAEQRKKAEHLSTGAFGKRTVIPRSLGRDEDGRAVLALTGDEKYGGLIGRRHRILGEIVEGGAMAASAVVINFDISNEIEIHGVTRL